MKEGLADKDLIGPGEVAICITTDGEALADLGGGSSIVEVVVVVSGSTGVGLLFLRPPRLSFRG